MPLYLVEKEVRPDVLPKPRPTKHLFTENTLGDLHGNAIKLIHVLVEIGLIKDFSAEHYAILIEIYHNAFHDIAAITTNDLHAFKTIIEDLQFHNTTMSLRLLGDELCDRGGCDWFTLIILAKLAMSGINFEILISNHSFDFMIALEKELPFNKIIKLNILSQRHSANQVQSLIDMRLISREEMFSLYKQFYLPRLKLISYTKTDQFIAMYTHAPVGMKSINDLLRDICKDRLNEETDFFKKIDLCNQIFQADYAQCFKIHTLDNIASFIQLIWNRSSEFYKDRPKELLTEHGLIPAYFIHGHDKTQSSSISLDNEFAKTPFIRPSHHKETYTLLGYSETPLLEYQEDIKEISKAPEFEHRIDLLEHNFTVATGSAIDRELDSEPLNVDEKRVRPNNLSDLSSIKTLTDFVGIMSSLNEDTLANFFVTMEKQNPELLKFADEQNHTNPPFPKNHWRMYSLFAQNNKDALVWQKLISVYQFKIILRELSISKQDLLSRKKFLDVSLSKLPLLSRWF